MSESLGVAELKRRFSEILNRIEMRGERIAVRRRGRTVAIIAPAEGDEESAGQVKPRRGLAAAAGAWEDHPDIDRFLEHIRAARDESPDRPMEALK